MDVTLKDFKIREAMPKDVPQILSFIRELAEYEKLLHEVVATEQSLFDSFFGEAPVAKALIGELNGEPVASAVYFHTFSTFLGRPGMYLEDLYVRPMVRGNGFGKIMLSHLAHLAKEKNCGRLEWSVLDWNESAIKFYHSLGATSMDGWTMQRVSGESLDKLVNINERETS